MKAKEKAKELVDVFQYKGIYITDVRMSEECAIESALICIDKMIETLLPYGGILYVKEEVEELEEVKQEINKL